MQPFSGWALEGVTLYRLSSAVPDRSTATVVGLDDATGEVLQNAALLRRLSGQPPEVLAARTFDVHLGQQGGTPLTPGDRGRLGSDAEWAMVQPARREGDEVIFYGWRGEMAPELVEHTLSARTFEVSSRTVIDAIVASGRRAAVGGPRCLPRSTCGCWSGCASFQLVRVPGRPPDQAIFVVSGDEEGLLHTMRRDCATVEGRETCARTCRFDTLEAQCDDAIVPESEACTEACPPSEAFYRCDLFEDGCRPVDHPVRRAAAGG